MANNAIAFITGLGTGYLSAKEKQKDRERQDKKDAQSNELHDARMYELNKSKRKDDATADAYKPATVNENAVTLDVSGKPVVYDDAAVAGSDFRQARAMQESNPPAEGLPALPPVAAPKPTFAAGGIAYGDKTAAQAGADAYNTPDAGNKRAATALRGIGDYAGASQLESTSRQGKLADIQLTKAEKEQIQDTAFREVTEQFSRNGWNALPKIYESYNDGKTAKVAEDGKGGATVSVFDSKGVQVGQKVFKDEMSFITDSVSRLDPKLWVTMKVQERKDAQTQTNLDRKDTREDAESGAKVGYYNSLSGKYDAQAANGGAAPRAPLVERMSEIDKTTLVNLNKQRDTIHTTLTKGLADGSLDEAAPGTQRLRADMAMLNAKERQMHGKYEGDQGTPDPLGVRKPAAAGKATTVANPMAGNFSASKQGQVDTLYQEMRQANERLSKPGITDEERVRAEGDITSLTKELKNLGVKANPAAAAPVAAPAAPMAVTQAIPAPVAAAAPAVPAAPVAPAAKPAAGPTPGQVQANNIAAALGAGSSSSIDKIIAAKVPAIQSASAGLQQAKVQLQAVAKSGDPQALQVAAANVQAARNAIDAMLQDINKPQADAVRQAAGYFQ